jgi:hypothetical protein
MLFLEEIHLTGVSDEPITATVMKLPALALSPLWLCSGLFREALPGSTCSDGANEKSEQCALLFDHWSTTI